MAILIGFKPYVLNAYAALVGEKPGYAALQEHLQFIAAPGVGVTGYKAALEGFFGSTPTATLAASLLTNLGLGGSFSQAQAEAFLDSNPNNRVGAIIDLAQQLYSYAGDNAGLLTAKAEYAAKIDNSDIYSSNVGNVNGEALTAASGQTISLTTGADNRVGSAFDDLFNGFVQQNQNGANVNSFSTGDVIDGGDGVDTITATLIQDRIIEGSGQLLDINVRTTNVEIAKFEVLDENVVVDAGNMDSVTQYWSVNSDNSGLLLEDVRLGSKLSVTKEITFGMKDVDFQSGLTAQFDSASLKNAGTNTTNSQILVEAAYEFLGDGVTAANPTKDLFVTIKFTHDGKSFDSGFLSTSTSNVADTYVGLKDAIAAKLAADGFGNLVVEFGNDITSITTVNATTNVSTVKQLPITAKQIFIKDPAGNAFTGVLSAVGALASASASDVVSNITAIAPNVSTTQIESNLILDNAGRGSTAGDVVIGAMSNSNAGVEKFNVMVDRSSAIESLNTTNGKLKEIAITSLAGNGGLEVGSTQSGLNLIDASAFAGSNLMLGTTVEAGRNSIEDHDGGISSVATAPVNNLKTLSANIAANVTFIGSTTEADGVDTDQAYVYTTGSGADKVTFTLDGDSVDAEAESFTLTTNGGADTVTMKMDTAAGVSQGTSAILKNLKIDTGAGADTVNLDSYANFNIVTGADSDYVRINSVDLNGDATTGTLTVGQTTGAQTWGGASSDSRVLYQAKLTVTYGGLESTVDISTTAANKFVATQLTINAAIKAAIAANPEMAKLVSAADVMGTEQLKITSLIGGDNDLSIDVYQPKLIATGTAVAGEVLINSGDVTALRQGLLATDAYDATFSYDSEDFETAAEIAAVTSTATENFYGSVAQNGQGNEDSVYSLKLNATDKTGAALVAAGAYAYLNDANGGQTFGTDATTDVNFSTVNLGDGANDLLVVHSNDLSMNTMVIDGTFGKNTVVNFHDLSANFVNLDKNNVGLHQIDFTKILSNQTDPSTATGGNANNTDSALPIAVTLHDAANTFTANVTAANDVLAPANSVNVLHFNEDAVDSVKFADFTAAQLKDKLNDQAATVTTIVGGLDHTSLTIVEAGVNLIGTTQYHIFMVENMKNLGEYKVFKATSTLDSADKNKLANADVDDFTTVELLGTLDFGYSINFNLVGTTAASTLLAGLIASADTGSVVSVQGVDQTVLKTGGPVTVLTGDQLAVDMIAVVPVDAMGVTSITGAVADVKTVIASTQISTSSTYTVTATGVTVAAADTATIDADTTGLVTFSTLSKVTGTVAALKVFAAAETAGTAIAAITNYAVEASDATVTAADLALLDAANGNGAITTTNAGGWTITGINGLTVVATGSVDTLTFALADTGITLNSLAVADVLDLTADLDVTPLDAAASANAGAVAANGDWFFDGGTDTLTYWDNTGAGEAQTVVLTGVATLTATGADGLLTVATLG